ncbi:hypothetical protein VNI00_012769 [Paramarasmius palmivorus]|uniref:Autophagy-related protein 11 n=1 Tax=Paramarasmius palmivorus TaxID=297713 RepID=A0AAW0C4V3_9AGAR
MASQVISGHQPFNELPNDAAVALASVLHGKRPRRPPEIPPHDQLWLLMMECWCAESYSRPSIDDVLATLLGLEPRLMKSENGSGWSQELFTGIQSHVEHRYRRTEEMSKLLSTLAMVPASEPPPTQIIALPIESSLDPEAPEARVEIMDMTIPELRRQCVRYWGRISFKEFAKGDFALFLPVGNAVLKRRLWVAFGTCSHHFLYVEGFVADQLKIRDWIIARITKITERIAQNDSSNDPYGLGKGVKYYLLEVDDFVQKPPTVKLSTNPERLKRQCERYRRQAEDRISFRNLAVGDLALFLPSRSVKRTWTAFTGAPRIIATR